MVNITFKIDPAVKAEIERMVLLLGKRESEIGRSLLSIGLAEYRKRAGGLLVDFLIDATDELPAFQHSLPDVEILKSEPKPKK